ncbi:MAG: hypothetical protein JJT78_05820 [Leptospira sp.]|nr:hypothetical protein [Leptospira sp.]
MKHLILILSTILITNCSGEFSLNSVRGKEARKEIEELRGTTGLLSITSTSGINNNPTNNSVECEFPENSLTGSTLANPTPFQIPEANQVVNFRNTTGTNYFRSEVVVRSILDRDLSIKSLITSNNTTAGTSCGYKTSTVCTGSVTDSNFTTISGNFATGINMNPDECLIIKCEGSTDIRLKNDPNSGTFRSGINLTNILLSPILFENLAAIQDDLDYTRQSVDDCKDFILLLSGIEISLTQQEISSFNRKRNVAFTCNDIRPTLNLPDSLLFTAMQAEQCRLIESHF